MRSLYEDLAANYGTEKKLRLLLERVCMVFHYSKIENLKDNFKKAYPYPIINESGDIHQNQAKSQNYVKWASILCTVFDVPIHIFDLTSSSQLNDLLQKKIPGKLHVYPLKNFDGLHKDDRELKAQQYKMALMDFLKPLETNLYVYDYLQRQYHPEELYLEAYVSAHRELYEAIEKKLYDKRSFSYARVLVLPNKGDSKNQELSDFEVKTEILKNCPVQLFDHICRCLINCDEMSNIAIEGKGFYCLKMPTRLYHYALINDGAYLMTEHYRYNKQQQIKPDILFIEEGKGELSTMRELYLGELKKLTSDKRVKLTTKDIQDVIYSLYEHSEIKHTHHYIDEKRKLAVRYFGKDI
ncbi:MAG: hypothetical protein V7724_07295 [Sediminicola sp.]